MRTNRTGLVMVGGLLMNLLSARAGTAGPAPRDLYFPPPGESLEKQARRPPRAVGFEPGIVTALRSRAPSGRWALWRHGYLVHVEGDFNRRTEVKSLRKTWHALAVGAAIRQGRIPSIDQELGVWCDALTGRHARATWRHVLTQTSGFDYPYGDEPAYAPGEIWTYSDKNPRHLCDALARVYGRKDFRDGYDEVMRAAYFDAIGLRGWETSAREDGIRLHLDLEDMGRLGLLVLARGRWEGRELIARSFVEQLETKQTRGARVDYDGPDDGRVDLDPGRFPEAPYGFMTWANTDGDYYPGADRSWAWGAGAGGSYVLWNHARGVVFAGFGVDTRPAADGIPHAIEAGLEGARKGETGSRFTDITLEAGTGGTTGRGRLGGHGAMFADADGDGRPDLYITMIFDDPMPDLFFRNVDGRRFASEGELRGIADFDGGSHGACFADLDGDGDYDLFNGTTWDHPEHPSVNNVFRNDGRGRFVDVTAGSGIPPERRWPTRGVLAFDMDRDGDLDLFCVTNYQGSADPPDERNEVYLNEGEMKFTPARAGDLWVAPCGQGATDTDFDGDGDIDVIAANRTGPVNVLRNDGTGRFTRVDPESIGVRHRAGDGITLADVDGDGDLDLLLASDDIGHLYASNGDGTFAPRQSFSGTDGYMGGFADLDHDGDVDLVFAGDDVAYLNDGSGTFVAGPRVPVEGINDPRGIAFADIDGDGDLDFAIGCKRSRNWLVRNDLASGSWLKVRLISPRGQAGAFGARVRVYEVGEGKKALVGLREGRSSHGYLGQDDPVLHFGLGARGRVDVVVTFLDGTTVKRSRVAANQTVTIDGREGR